MTSRSVALATVLALCLAPARAALAQPRLAPQRAFGGEIVPGEVLVKFRPGVDAQRRAAAAAALGHALVASIGREGWVHVRTAPGESVEEALAAYAQQPDVESAQPNFVYHASAVPNDTLYPMLWGLHNTGQTVMTSWNGVPTTQPAGSPLRYTTDNPPPQGGTDMSLEKAWDWITDCSSTVVAVVDTGVNYAHQDLAGSMWNGGGANPNHGKNFVGTGSTGDDATMDLAGHGTHVAGTIGAVGNNGMGTTGVCWKASIMAVRVLDESGSGTTVTIIQGIDFAVANGAKVINLSLGGPGPDSLFSDAITAAQDADVVVVVAAGNSNSSNDPIPNLTSGTPIYPCNFTQPNLLCVAALDQSYNLASFSNYGATSVDVGAPGTNIVSTWPGPMIGDALVSGWTFNPASGGWRYYSQSNLTALMDGSTTGTYANNANDHAWKALDVSGLAAYGNAMLHFGAALDVATGDYVEAAWDTSGADPFAPGGTSLGQIPGPVTTWPSFVPFAADVTGCIGTTCTIGFRLVSDNVTQTSHGVAITGLAIGAHVDGATSLNTENGTSMATPHVAGLAAMLRAYNPMFTYADVVAAIEGGGRTVSALAGKTTTGKAADAMGSLAFIQAPTGLAALVH